MDKKDFDFKVNQNRNFFREFNYIYKNNAIFEKLVKDNENLIQKSKIIKNQKDYKKLYNDAVNLSFGIDHLGDKVGLFIKKIKNPKLDTKIKQSGNYQYLNFECGDLYLRKNVSLKKDNKYCYKYFSKFVDILNVKLNRFRWDMHYDLPSENEISKLKKTETKKHCLLTKPLWTNTINYNFALNDKNDYLKNDNCLYITSDLLWHDINPIIKFTKKLNNLKKIIFIDYFFWYRGKLNLSQETIKKIKNYWKECMITGDIEHQKFTYYIKFICKNPNFLEFSDSPYLHRKRYIKKNSSLIKKLKHLRTSIDKNIKLEFNNLYYQGDGPVAFGVTHQEFLKINNII